MQKFDIYNLITKLSNYIKFGDFQEIKKCFLQFSTKIKILTFSGKFRNFHFFQL